MITPVRRAAALILLLPIAAAAASDCSSVHFLRQPGLFSDYRTIVAEVLVRTSKDQRPTVRGILLNGDWGTLRLCEKKVYVSVRWLVDPATPRTTQRRFENQQELEIALEGRSEAYFFVAQPWGETDAEAGKSEILRIETWSRGRVPLAREDFNRDRYHLLCFKCEALKPDDAALVER